MLCAFTCIFAQAPTAPAPLPTAQPTLAYLNQTIDWHRHLAVEEQLATEPTDILFFNDDREVAKQVLHLSFDFARAAAQLLGNPAAPGGGGQEHTAASSRYAALSRATTATDVEVKQLETELQSLKAKLETVTARQRQNLQIQMEETQSELNLAQTRGQTLRSLLQFVSGATGTAGSLLSQINELERSIPELEPEAGKSGHANTLPSAPANSQRVAPSGILDIATNLIALNRKSHALRDTIALTDSLAQSGQQLRAPLIASITAIAQQGDQLAKQADTSDPAQLKQLKQQLDALNQQFKQLSTVVLPLGKQSILLDLYKSNVDRWRSAAKSEASLELKNLTLRLAVLGGILVVILALAEIWRRATFRYVRDVRRRYQFLLLRRILLWSAIGLTLAFGLATELGSLATFAGLITAGIAVALQNVILAIAGYFFLIGKYGVRVGDRVQISGVNGDVLDIGMIRLHIMEVGAGAGHQPTGRVVAFSNSIVFQPSAGFFKQIPGTSFVWHEVTLILAPEGDYRAAEKRMLAAIEKVYATYRGRIEEQHQEMQRTLNIMVEVPQPQSRLHLTQTGLEIVIRYPIVLEDAAEINDKITRELLQALEQPPKLKLVGSGTPNIQPVRDGVATAPAEQPVRT